MSFPRYPMYRESGVEWLGEVPAHWEVAPLKRVATLRSGDTITADRIEATGTYPVLGGNGLRGYTTEFTHDGHFPVVGRQGALCGNVNYGAGRFWASEHAVVAVPNDAVDTIWLGELLRGMDLNQYSTAAAQPGLSVEMLANLRTVWPPLAEQRAIAKFIRRETATTDTLVAEQQQLIELLAEKRQAVVSHAVTKGLNPDAPVKPSSTESLGDCPAHWVIRTIKTFATLHRGYDLTDAERQEGPYSVVTSGGIAGVHNEFKARGPGVVTGRYGSTGRLFYVERDFWPHNTALYVSDFHGNSPRFAWYSLQTVDFAAHSAKAAVPGIDRNDIHVLPVAVPPLGEQRAIAEHLDQQTLMLDGLVVEAERAIALLHERRTALISAAVTGKIDVRDLAAQSTDAPRLTDLTPAA